MTDDPKTKLQEMGTQLPANEIAEVTPAPKHELMAGGAVRPIVPQSMEDAYRIAQAVVQARMTPRGIDTPQQALVAIMQGMEVGMTPMQSMQRIAIINGRPAIYGDAAIGLVRASGKLEHMKEWIEGTLKDDDLVAVCEVQRKGDTVKATAAFGIEDAKLAGLWGKSGPWQQYPKRMLQMRARGFALRDMFADVLGGMYLREEIEEVEVKDVTPVEPSNVVPLKAEGIIPSRDPTASYAEVDAALEADIAADVPRETIEKPKRRQTTKKAAKKAGTSKRTRTPAKTKKAADGPDTASERDFASEAKAIRQKFWKAADTKELVDLWNEHVLPEEAWPKDELFAVNRTYNERLAKLEDDAS